MKHLDRLMNGMWRLALIAGPVILFAFSPKLVLMLTLVFGAGYALGWGIETARNIDKNTDI